MDFASIFIFGYFYLYLFMDLKVIKGNNHYLYDNIEEFNALNPGNKVKGTWREGDEGDWIYTDDDYICQILKKSMMFIVPC